MSKFLSEEWAADVTAALGQHQGFKNAIGTADLKIQFVVNDGPDGDMEYFLDSGGGTLDDGRGLHRRPGCDGAAEL